MNKLLWVKSSCASVVESLGYRSTKNESRKINGSFTLADAYPIPAADVELVCELLASDNTPFELE